MIEVRFVGAEGVVTVLAAPGARLLDVAQAAGQPLEGTCDGQMACSTCHVLVDEDDFGRLPPAGLDEEDLLDFARHSSKTSRLACQIILDEGLVTLNVRMPS